MKGSVVNKEKTSTAVKRERSTEGDTFLDRLKSLKNQHDNGEQRKADFLLASITTPDYITCDDITVHAADFYRNFEVLLEKLAKKGDTHVYITLAEPDTMGSHNTRLNASPFSAYHPDGKPNLAYYSSKYPAVTDSRMSCTSWARMVSWANSSRKSQGKAMASGVVAGTYDRMGNIIERHILEMYRCLIDGWNRLHPEIRVMSTTFKRGQNMTFNLAWD